jgi:hypothetical protein
MDNSKFVYTLMWYKSKGGAVTNSADVGSLKSICLIESSRPLSYNRTKTQLMLSSEVQPGEECNPVERNNKESQGQHHVDVITHFTFAIVLSDGKEHILRGSKVDKLIKWMNGLAQASNLAYDPINKEWNRVAMQTLIQTRELKKAKEAAELRAKLESAIVNQTIENPLLKRASARPVEPQAAAYLVKRKEILALSQELDAAEESQLKIKAELDFVEKDLSDSLRRAVATHSADGTLASSQFGDSAETSIDALAQSSLLANAQSEFTLHEVLAGKARVQRLNGESAKKYKDRLMKRLVSLTALDLQLQQELDFLAESVRKAKEDVSCVL